MCRGNHSNYLQAVLQGGRGGRAPALPGQVRARDLAPRLQPCPRVRVAAGRRGAVLVPAAAGEELQPGDGVEPHPELLLRLQRPGGARPRAQARLQPAQDEPRQQAAGRADQVQERQVP